MEAAVVFSLLISSESDSNSNKNLIWMLESEQEVKNLQFIEKTLKKLGFELNYFKFKFKKIYRVSERFKGGYLHCFRLFLKIKNSSPK